MGEERFGEFVLVRRHERGHVAELVLDRPKAMNAVSTEMARSVAGACAALGADRDVRAVVLTSTHERAFCVGADLKERNSLQRRRAGAAAAGGARRVHRGAGAADARRSPPCTGSRWAAGSSWPCPAT